MTRGRPLGALGLVLAGAGLLGGCGAGASAGVLTNADIPAALQLRLNTSPLARNLATVFNRTYPGCEGRFAVFTAQGRPPTPVADGPTIYRQLFSESAVCPAAARAQSVFAMVSTEVERAGGHRIGGLADAAVLAHTVTARANEYALFWRDRTDLGFVQLTGPRGVSSITAAETELLARRQVAGH